MCYENLIQEIDYLLRVFGGSDILKAKKRGRPMRRAPGVTTDKGFYINKRGEFVIYLWDPKIGFHFIRVKNRRKPVPAKGKSGPPPNYFRLKQRPDADGVDVFWGSEDQGTYIGSLRINEQNQKWEITENATGKKEEPLQYDAVDDALHYLIRQHWNKKSRDKRAEEVEEELMQSPQLRSRRYQRPSSRDFSMRGVLSGYGMGSALGSALAERYGVQMAREILAQVGPQGIPAQMVQGVLRRSVGSYNNIEKSNMGLCIRVIG